MLAYRLVTRLPVSCREDFVRLEAEVVPQAAEDGGVVFDDKDAVS